MSQKLHSNIFVGSLVIALISLLFSRAALSIALGILVANWVLEGNFSEKWNRFKSNPLALLFIGFFVIHLFGILYTEHTAELSRDLLIKLPLLLVPIVLVTTKPLEQKSLFYIFQAFILSCILATLYCLGAALMKNIELGFTLERAWDCIANGGCTDGKMLFAYRYFTYESFSRFISLHPTYLALFLNMASALVIWFWWESRKTGQKSFPIATFSTLAYLIWMVFMLSSRMQILNLLIIGMGGIIIWAIQSKRTVKGLGILATIGLLSSVIIFSNPQNKSRFEDIFQKKELKVEKVHESGSAVRKHIWKTSFGLFSQSPWFGFGTGDVKNSLVDKYEDQGFEYGADHSMNAHSQFIESSLALGFVGLIYLILLFALPAYFALHQRNFLYLTFLFLFALSCLTESFFNRQLGVNFYVYLNAILAFQIPKMQLETLLNSF